MNTPFTEKDSLATIQNMIDNAQQRFKEKGEIAILWGWLVFGASIAHFIMLKSQFVDPSFAWIVWPVISIVGLMMQFRIIKKKSRRQEAVSYQDRAIMFIWSGVILLYFFVLFLSFSSQISWTIAYSLLLMLFGMGSFITGGLIRSTPFIIGGLLGIPIAIATLYTSNEYILLWMALGMICFNLVPAYLLRAANSDL